MDLIDKLKELAGRIERQKSSVLTEQAAKTAFVLPFLQTLGYDVFNPAEVVPEFTADHGVKKGEKVDYAIKLDGGIAILIECKPIGADLEAKHASQLFRYFSVTDARFSILTDGVRYVFFSDIEKPNRMDDRPFFEFSMLQFADSDVEELKKFSKHAFDLDAILSSANNLKYHKSIISELRAEFDSPTEDFVRLFTGRVYNGRFTQQIKEQFTDLTRSAMRAYIRERINERLKSALDSDRADPAAQPESTKNEKTEVNSGIETTPEELEAYRIVRAIGAELVDPDRIVMRDAKSYCAILLDDNNRRTVCRFHFGKSRMAITIFAPDNESRLDIEKITQIYKYRDLLVSAISQYDKDASRSG